MGKKFISLTLALTLIIGTFAGCSGNSNSSGAAGSKSAASSESAGAAKKDTLTIAAAAEFSTLDPNALPSSADINFAANIFDGLIYLDPKTNDIKPGLAESWEASQDGKSYTFKLRKGVKFHNGDELTTKDVAKTLDRFTTEEWFKFASFAIKDYKVVDDYTITINLKYSYGLFLSMLCYMYVIDANYFKSVDKETFSRKPVGTGPYKFVEWTTGEKLTLEANEDYWGNKPKIKNVVVKFISDTNTALVALQTGDIDLSFDVTSADYKKAEQDPNLAVDKSSSSYYQYIAFHSQKVDEKVRQALSYAIDRKALDTIVNEGLGTLSNVPLTEKQEGYTTDLTTYEYDPEKAKQLLQEAGVKDLTLNLTAAESTSTTKLAQSLQSYFSAVGVNLEINLIEKGTFFATMKDGKYDVTYGGYPMELANTDSCYYDMFHKDGTWNLPHVNDPEVNRLLEGARSEIDSKKRSEAYVKVNQLLAEKAYYVPLYFTPSLVVYNKNLKGVSAVRNKKYLYADFSW